MNNLVMFFGNDMSVLEGAWGVLGGRGGGGGEGYAMCQILILITQLFLHMFFGPIISIRTLGTLDRIKMQI